jgi:hypothetical protein
MELASAAADALQFTIRDSLLRQSGYAGPGPQLKFRSPQSVKICVRLWLRIGNSGLPARESFRSSFTRVGACFEFLLSRLRELRVLLLPPLATAEPVLATGRVRPIRHGTDSLRRTGGQGGGGFESPSPKLALDTFPHFSDKEDEGYVARRFSVSSVGLNRRAESLLERRLARLRDFPMTPSTRQKPHSNTLCRRSTRHLEIKS